MPKIEFSVEVLNLNFISGSRYLGAYLGPQKESEALVKPQVEAWAHGVRVLSKIVRRHPQSAYVVLGLTFQLKWQYLQRTVSEVETIIGPIEEALREKFFPAVVGGEEINANFWKILGHSVKPGRLCIPDHRLSEDSEYNISRSAIVELVYSLLGGYSLNYT